MTRPRALIRAAAVAATGVLLAAGTPLAAGAAPHRLQRADTLRMSVENVSPSSPTPTATAKSLSVTIRLENTTDVDLKKVRLVAERGDPLESQAALDAALRRTGAPSSPGLPIPALHPTPIDVPAQGAVDATFTTQYSRTNDGSGICLCAYAVYPMYFSAHADGVDGVDQRLGVTVTFLPVFPFKPSPDRVNWIWPLIDQPHRLFQTTQFTDDQLAGTVASGGRLDRALRVVEEVGPDIPLTLVIDPELLDELAVMAGAGGYTVLVGGKSVRGTGGEAAAAWLARLRAVLESDAKVHVEYTPYADPDIESLTRSGQSWTNVMPQPMHDRIDHALGDGTTTASVAWPAGGVMSAKTLATATSSGMNLVVLDAAALTPRAAAGAIPRGLARIESNGRDLAVAVVSPTMERYVTQAIGVNGSTALPQLVAELAVRAAQENDVQHPVVLTAPRYVDASVTSAVRAIRDTSRSTFSTPISMRDAVAGDLLPTARSKLAAVPASAPSLPDALRDATTRMANTLPDVTALLTPPPPAKGVTATPDAAAEALLAELPVANQRAESSAWRRQDVATTAIARAYATALNERIDSIENGVQIVRPSSGAYTLASNSSPLPITIENKLPYPVFVRISITTDVNGLPGFSTSDIGVKSIDSNQKRTLNVPTKTARNGRIKVHAVLLTPNNVALGDSVPLTIRSTFLGAIGVIITISAGVVLALALLIRASRQVRKRRLSATASTDAAAEREDEAVS